MSIPKRYLVCFSAWMVLMVSYLCRANMSVAIIAMAKVPGTNDSKLNFVPRLDFTLTQQGSILGAYFYGYLATNFAGCIFSILIGVRRTMIVSLSGAIFFTIILPPLSYITGYEYYLIVFSRVMLGLFFGPLYACMHQLLASWSPVNERTKMAVITHSGNIIGLLLAFSLGPVVTISVNWWEFYIYFAGIIGIISLIIWVCFAYDDPSKHPSISEFEKKLIMNSLNEGNTHEPETLQNIPFKSIFTCTETYIIALAHMGNNFIIYIFLTGQPKYYKQVFSLSPVYASLLSIIPFIVNFTFQMISSYFTTYLQRTTHKSITFYRKVNGFIGFVGAVIFMIPIGFVGTSSLAGSVVLLSLSMGFVAFNQAGFFTQMIDIAPKYSGITMGICNTIGSISGFVSPAMFSSYTEKYGNSEGWKYSFITTGVLSLCFGLAWLIFSSSELQKWAKDDFITAVSKESIENIV